MRYGISFTFQSGYIQIKSGYQLLVDYWYFTFQSSSIQIFSWRYSNLDASCLYIPIWFYSNPIRYISVKYHLFLYIPIWFYSNYTGKGYSGGREWTLHSNLVLFKSLKALRQGEDLQLYIPIWFYSNLERVGTTDFPYILYIPIWFYSNVRRLQIRYINATFTFQSGSIQIKTQWMLLSVVSSLHSNLVIFKCKLKSRCNSWYIELYIPIWLYSNFLFAPLRYGLSSFTFQSGYIQIISLASPALHLDTFTFQSGYIQIGREGKGWYSG